MTEPAAKILVSACLMGRPVRYDGGAKTLAHSLLDRWKAEGRLVTICPEVSAGLPVPRPPAEIAAGTGEDALTGTAKIRDAQGADLTEAFLAGAQATLQAALANHCRYALLIDGSPSCGSTFIYDGSFSGRTRPGNGVVAALLRRNGIAVYAPAEIEALDRALSEDRDGPAEKA